MSINHDPFTISRRKYIRNKAVLNNLTKKIDAGQNIEEFKIKRKKDLMFQNLILTNQTNSTISTQIKTNYDQFASEKILKFEAERIDSVNQNLCFTKIKPDEKQKSPENGRKIFRASIFKKGSLEECQSEESSLEFYVDCQHKLKNILLLQFP